MAESKDGDLATRLHKWALQEVHFHPQGRHVNAPLPTVDHFREICRGPLLDIWTHVINKVHSAQTVKKIHGNLALKGKQSKSYKVKYKSDEQFDNTKQDLLDRRAQLSGEINSVLTDVSHLENDLARLEEEILNTESEYQKASSNISNLRRKKCLLQAYSGQCKDLRKQYEEYTSQMNNRMEKITSRAKKGSDTEEYYSRKKSSTDEDHYTNGHSSGLETKCGREVRKTCDHVGKFLLQVLQGEFGTDRSVFQRKKEGLWKHVEDSLGSHSIQQIYQALVSNTQDAAFYVRDQTSKINIRSDAEKLRYKYEKTGELRDVSRSPTLLQSVHQLLEENQVQQIKRFVETEKYRNAAWKQEQHINDLNKQMDFKLRKMFPKEENLKLARALIDSEIELAGKRAALHCLNEEATLLRETIAQALREKEVLYAKYQKIQDFREIADKKQELIRVLVKQNMNARSRLDAQREEILQYIRRSLATHHTEAKTLKTSLQGSVVTEVEKFASLYLPYLLFSELPGSVLKVAVLDMSIKQTTDPVAIASRQALQTVLKHLKFPSYLAPEVLLPRCLEIKNEIDQFDYKVTSSDDFLQQRLRAGNKDIVTTILDLCSTAAEQDRQQLEQVLPVLQKRISKSTAALDKCTEVKGRVQQWWEQPAQNTVGWILVDQNNLQHWKDKWSVLVTKYRQLMVQK